MKMKKMMKQMYYAIKDSAFNLCVMIAAVAMVSGDNACFVFFYEPEKPENLSQISKNDILTFLHK